MTTDSTRRTARGKGRKAGDPRPKKPRKDFPLYPHRNGYWCKKVKGANHYFGKWKDDPKGQRALEKWAEEKDDLLAGRIPKDNAGETTVADAVNFSAGILNVYRRFYLFSINHVIRIYGRTCKYGIVIRIPIRIKFDNFPDDNRIRLFRQLPGGHRKHHCR